jgi:hypothetical protein
LREVEWKCTHTLASISSGLSANRAASPWTTALRTLRVKIHHQLISR